MGSFFQKLKEFVFPKDEKNVLILGYTTAGKTTLIEQLIQKKVLKESRRETHGSKTREIKIELGDTSHNFKATDVGGSEVYQDIFWKSEIARATGIIYVIDVSLINECEGMMNDQHNWQFDGSHCPNYENDGVTRCGCEDNKMFNNSRKAKSFAFSILDTGKPILVFLNKLDLEGSQPIHSKEEIIQLYNLDGNNGYNTRIMTGSALTGDNVFDGIKWLFENMS